jgi:hypothetical protein
MKSHTLLLCLAFAGVLGMSAPARAQEPARAPAAAASVPPPSKTRPRPMTATEQRDSASVPGELRPAEPVVPQIRVPLGKRQEAPESRAEAQRRNRAEARGGIDDDVARCKAAATAAARDECQARLRKSGKGQ